MTSVFIYPDLISEIRRACFQHVQGKVSADHLQHVIRRGEMGIVALEEKDIRKFLTDAEGMLEEIKFAFDDELQLTESQKVAKQVLHWLGKREQIDQPPSSSGA